MAYIVIKTIKGRQYRYLQRTYREGGRVRTECIYLGAVGGTTRKKGVLRRIGEFIEANRTPRHGLPDEDTCLKQHNARVEAEKAAREKALKELHDLYGLKLPGTNSQPAAGSEGQKEAPSVEGAKSE